MVIFEEDEEQNEIDFQRKQLPDTEDTNQPIPTSFRRISRRKLYSKHNRHSKHHHDLNDVVEEDGGGAYYPRYKIVDYDEDNLKMKLIRVYPRIVGNGSDGGNVDGGRGDIGINNDNGDIGIVDDDGGRGGIDNDNVAVDSDGGGGRSGIVVGIDNDDIKVVGNVDCSDDGYGERKGDLKMKIVFDSY